MVQKRIAAIHDLSCFGKCSLTVALPVISSMGIECAVVPTAVLTGHFAALPQVSVLDLTDRMAELADHWQAGGVEFDGIFSGYLSSPQQARQVADFVCRFRRENTLFVADPAMADRGTLYRGFDETQVDAMKALCAMADVTVPNVTEACLMLGMDYAPIQSRGQIEALLDGMVKLGARQAVITGVSTEENRVGIACRSGEAVKFFDREKVPGHYNGTGDLFASVLTGCLVRGQDFFSSAKTAMDFTGHVIAQTAKNPHHRPYGVDLEQHLGELAEFLSL